MNVNSFFKNIRYFIKTSKSLPEVGRKMFWIYDVASKGQGNRKSKFHFKFPEPLGLLKFTVRNNGGSDAFIISEVFEHQCYRIDVLNKDASGPVIVDLGANAGFTSVYFSKVFPGAKIICVEPMPNNLSVLRENLKENHVTAEVYEAAISTTDGLLEMEISDQDYGHKVHNIEFGKAVGNQLISVRAITIGSIMQEQKIDKIDILKIDIEGYEGVLFETNNQWLRSVDRIIMEIHENISIERITEIAKQYSFTSVTESKGNWIFSKGN